MMAVVLIFILAAPVCRGQRVGTLTAQQIMENLAGTFSDVTDLTVSLEADVSMERLRVPRMKVTMYFKKPDRVRFVSESFAMVPREGIFVNPELLRSRYEARLLGEEEVEGKTCFRLQLTPRAADVRQRQIVIWVDRATWTLARTQSVPYEGRSVTIDFVYERVDSRYWLPVRTTAVFASSGEDTLGQALQPEIPAAQQFSELRRPMRSGTITIRYAGYVVNAGLSDELFLSQDEE
jgi:outer membrane lipoprotein-sorting protein